MLCPALDQLPREGNLVDNVIVQETNHTGVQHVSDMLSPRGARRPSTSAHGSEPEMTTARSPFSLRSLSRPPVEDAEVDNRHCDKLPGYDNYVNCPNRRHLSA
jgi:hypothetical protein